MGVIITESGMDFGEYDKRYVFHIEKSKQYTKKLLSNGIKCCEFILLRNNKIFFVEAKTSCPKQITAETAKEKIEKYEDNIREIVLKMKHSIMLYSNILLSRYDSEGVPELLRNKDLSGVHMCFVLVVKNAKTEWLISYKERLSKELKDISAIYKMPDILVINEETAKKKNLIIEKAE